MQNILPWQNYSWECESKSKVYFLMHFGNYAMTQNNDKAFLNSWQNFFASIWERFCNLAFLDLIILWNISLFVISEIRFWSPCVTTYDDLESKIKTQDTSPQFCKCQQWKNDACAIGSYVFEITWFETKRSGHMAIMRNPYRLPYPKSAFIKLDKGVKCLIKSALKCVFVALTKNQLLL